MTKQTGIIFLDVAKDLNNRLRNVSHGKVLAFLILATMVLTGFSTVSFGAQSIQSASAVQTPLVSAPSSSATDNIYINGSVSNFATHAIASGSFSMQPVTTVLASGSFSMQPATTVLASGTVEIPAGGKDNITWSVTGILELYVYVSPFVGSSLSSFTYYTPPLPTSDTLSNPFSYPINASYHITGYYDPSPVVKSWTIPTGTLALAYTYSSSSYVINSNLLVGTYYPTLPTSATFSYLISASAALSTVLVAYSVTGYSNPSSVAVGWTVPAGTSSLTYSWSSSSGQVSSTLKSGTYNSSFPISTTFSYSISSSISVAYVTYSVYVASTSFYSTFASGAIGISITQNQNWWNSTLAKYSLSSSIAPNGYAVTFQVDHILSVGYGTGAPVDTLFYSGTGSGTVTASAAYVSAQGLGAESNGSTILSFGSEELINYAPIISSKSVTFSGSGSTAQLSVDVTEAVSSEVQAVFVAWGDSHYSNSAPTTSTSFLFTHQYSDIGNYSIRVMAINDPNAPEGFLSSNATLSYAITMNTTFNPLSGSILYNAGAASIVVSTDGNVRVANVSLSVNGLLVYPSFTYSGNTLTSQYTLRQSGSINYVLIWKLTGGGISVSYTIYYYSPKIPATYSQWIGMSYNTTTGTVPVSVRYFVPVNLTNPVANSATPNGMTQLIVIDWNNYKQYLNGNVSNVEVFGPTWLPLYAWMENGNSNTSWSDVWVNLSTNSIPAGGRMTIFLGFYSKGTFDLGANSYWGEADWLSPVYGEWSNAQDVFYKYWSFAGTSLPTGFVFGSSDGTGLGSYSVDNGLTLNVNNSHPDYFQTVMYTTLIPFNSYAVQASMATDSVAFSVSYGQLVSSSETNQTFAVSAANYSIGAGSVTGAGTSTIPHASDAAAYVGFTVYDYVNVTAGINDAGVSTEIVAGSRPYNLSVYYNTTGLSAGSRYAGVALSQAGNLLAATTLTLRYLMVRVAPPSNEMPTLTYGIVQNAASYSVLRYYYTQADPIATSATEDIYVYAIDKEINANTVYVYYNSSWVFLSASVNYLNASYTPNTIQISNVSGLTSFQIEFIEPIAVSHPFSTVVLNLIPSVAIGQTAGVDLPSSFLEVFINGNELYQNTFQAVIGGNYTVTVESAFLSVMFQGNITPTTLDYSVALRLNFSSIEWTNENQNEAIAVYAEQNGLRQAITMVNPTATTLPYYFPATSTPYDFTFVYYNYSETSSGIFLGYIPIKAVSANITVSGLMSQVFFGFNLVDMSQEINQTQDTISSAISNIQVILYGQGANIENLTLSVLLNLSLDNSNVQNVLTQVITNEKFIQSLVNNLNISSTTEIDFVDSLLNSTSISLSDKISFVNTLINQTGYVNAKYPITITNPPTGTGMYQQLFTISNPSTHGINSQGSNFEITYTNGTPVYSWIQSINSTSLVVWSKLPYATSSVNLETFPSFENLLSATGYLGNATISNVKYVFTAGTLAGLTDTLPAGSPSGSFGFYAYSVSGYYIYMPTLDYGTNTNISFYVWSNGLGDVFFDANSTGAGQMLRFDTRGGSPHSQFASTTSWTSWGDPPVNTFDPSASTWYEGIIHFNSNGTVIGYWSYASQNAYGQNATSYYTVAHDGNYMGFIGDGLGSAYVTYWNGVRVNGTAVSLNRPITPSPMPTFTIGSPTYSNKTSLAVLDTILNIVNSTLDNTNLNLTTKANLIYSLISNVNVSMQDKLNLISNNIKDFQSNLTVLTTFVNNTVNYIKTLETSINQNLTIQYGIVNETLFLARQNFTAISSSIQSNYNSLISSQDFQDSLINITKSDVSVGFSYSNNLINSTSANLVVHDNLINDTINTIKSITIEVSQNLTIQNSTLNEIEFIAKQNFTSLNSTVKNNFDTLIVSQDFQDSLVNATITDVHTGFTYSDDLINSTTSDLSIQDNLINDTITSIKGLEVKFNSNLTVANSSIAELEFLSTQRSTYLNSTILDYYQSTLQNITTEYSYIKGMNVTQLDYLTAIQSVVGKIQNNVTVTDSFINDTVTKVDNFVSIVENEILNNITSNSFNITTRETVIRNLVAMDLQEANATFSYRLQFGTPTVVGNNFTFPVFVTLFNGQVANITVTNQAWQDLKVFYESGSNNTTLNFTVTGIKAGYFKLTIYDVTSAEVRQIVAGQGLITAQGEVKVGTLSNLAAGVIGSQQISNPNHILSDTLAFFGFKTGPPGGWADVKWFYSYAIGWASSGVLAAVVFYYYAWRIVHDRMKEKKDDEEKEEKRKKDEEMRKDLKDIKNKLNDGGGQ